MADNAILFKDAAGANFTGRTIDLGSGIVANGMVPVRPDGAGGAAVDLQALLTALGTQTTSAAILAKLSADPATQATLAAVLAKLSADPATQTTLGAVLAKLSADPATQTTLAALSAKLPVAVGAQTGANSLSVVGSSDTPLATVASNFAGPVSGSTIARLANTTAYAIGQLVGGHATAGNAANIITFANIARVNGGAVRIDRIRLYKSLANLVGTFQLILFRAAPALAVGDAGALAGNVPVGNAAAAAREIGRFNFDFTNALLGSDGSVVSGIPTIGPAILAQAAAGSRDLFGVLIATSAYVPASGETFSPLAESYAF